MALFFLAGSNNHGHLAAFHLGSLFDLCKLFNIGFNPLHELHPDFLVRHLPSAEADGDLALVPMLKETYQVAQFDLIIPFFSSRPEFYFLQLDLFLLFLGRSLGFLFLEHLFSVVHDLADHRLGVRSQLDQVQLFLCRFLEGFLQRYDADLIAL